MTRTAGLAVVIGLGRSGIACARVLFAEGWRVHVVDQSDGDRTRALARELPAAVDVTLGGYSDAVVEGADLVCPSPGVPWDAPVLQRARRRGIAVRSEMQLVFDRFPGRIIGITGTNGKTTTTALTGAIIAAGGERVHVGGNIGDTVLDRLAGIRPEDWLVLELSSFQLESVAHPRCRLAAVLNITPDHLDRHGTFDNYVATKRRLVEAVDPEGAVALWNRDATTPTMAAAAAAPVVLFGEDVVDSDGAAVRGGDVVILDDGRSIPVMPRRDIPLFGEHNLLNVLAAVCLGHHAGVEEEAIARAVREFTAVPHRLQPVLEHAGVLWVNDSKATNPDAAIRALEAFPDRDVVWIGGGRSKGLAPDALADAVAHRARHAVLNGASAEELDEALAGRGFAARTRVATLAEAVAAAHAIARRGDVVLLAPGYTSFDQYDDFEQRGEAFATLAHEAAAAPSRRA